MHLLDWLGSLLAPVRETAVTKRKPTRSYRERFIPTLRVTKLEPRCVLNGAPIPTHAVPPPPAAVSAPAVASNPNVLVVAAADTLNHQRQPGQHNDVVRFVRDGANVDIFVNGAETESVPLAQIGSIDIQGTGNETLVLDYSGGNPLPSGGLVFESADGAVPQATLIIEGGTAQSANLTLRTGGSGSIAIDGTQVAFSGVESIVETLNVSNLSIALAEGGQTWSLGNATQPAESVLQSPSGVRLTFADPTGSLTVDSRAAGAAAGETLQVGNLDLAAGTSPTILGRASDTVNVTGNIDLGAASLAIFAGTDTLSGTITSHGGSVTLTGTSAVTISDSGEIRDPGGLITINAGPVGTLLDSGIIDASSSTAGTTGGSVGLLGEYVGLTGQALVDVSGSAGGGAVRIGGDFHGTNTAIEDAAKSYIGANVTIAADALENGSGGTIVVWSNQATMYYGHIEARGGAAGGNGGKVEISSRGNLAEQGLVDLNAPQGQLGSLLLDPATITISHGASAADDAQLPTILFGNTGVSYTISDTAISGATADVTLEAIQSISADPGVAVTLSGHNLIIETKNDGGNAGFIDLSQGSFAVTGTGSITILGSANGAAAGNVTVGALTVSSGNINIGTGNGTVALKGAVGAGAGTVRLQGAGNIAESGSGAVTAASLGAATSSGNITLTGSNSVGTFAAKAAGGTITLLDSGALTIGSVTADANINFAVTNGVTTTSANVALGTSGAGATLTLDQAIAAGTGIVVLNAAGDVTESGSGAVTASALGVVTTSGGITLTSGINITNFAAGTSGGNVALLDGLPLTIGDVAAGTGFTGANGITTGGGDVSLDSTGALQVAAGINAGAGAVRLLAKGDVSETGGGAITASILGVRNASTTAGNVTLAGSNAVGTFAAGDAFGGGTITLLDTGPLTIGSVTADANIPFLAIAGVATTTTGNISLGTSGAGAALTISQTIAAGTGNVLLNAAGDVTESGSGAVTASALGVVTTAGQITLTSGISMTTFAAVTSGGNVTLLDGSSLTIGSVPAGTGFTGATGVATSGGNVSLGASGTLQVKNAISAGAGTVRLEATGDVSETGSGAITASILGVGTAGNITLAGNNSVGTFAASSGGAIALNDTGPLTIGSAGPDGNIGFLQTDGATTTANGNISLGTSGSGATLTINQAINAGTATTGGTVRLKAAGAIIQSAAISGSTLGVETSVGDILLAGGNSIATFAASNTATGGAVTFNDGTDLTIGGVALDGSIGFVAVNGIQTSSGNVSVGTTGALAVNQAINAGTASTGGIVRLQAAGVGQSGAISGSELGVVTSLGSLTLLAANSVGTFAASDLTGGTVTLNDTASLTIGSIAADGNISFALTNGITASNADVALTTTGALTVAQAIAAGTGVVVLTAKGDVTESGSGAVTAAALGVVTTTGSITLNSGIDVTTFAASDTDPAGTVTLVDGAALTIGTVNLGGTPFATGVTTAGGAISLSSASTLQIADSVMSAGGKITLSSGTDLQVNGAITSSGGDVSLGSGTALTIGDAVNAGAGTVRMHAGLDVTESGTGAISASGLGVASTGGNITLTTAVSVSTFAASTVGGAVTLSDGSALTIGFVGTDADIGFADTVGVTSNNGDVALSSMGNVTVSQAISAGTGTARLVSGNNLVWTNGAIQSKDLLLEAQNGIGTSGTFVQVNVSGQLAAETTGLAANGGVFVTQVAAAGNLTIGTVTDLALNNVNGISTTNNGSIDVETAQGNLNVNADVLTTNLLGDGLGTVKLVADSSGAAGTFALNLGGNVHVRSGALTSSAITLQGNDLNIAPSAAIHATGAAGGVQLITSTPSVAMTIGPTSDVAGTYSVTDAELARIIDADVITIGKAGVQTGDVTFRTVVLPVDQLDGTFPDLIVNQASAGKITLDDEGTATALDAGSGNITINAGPAGIFAVNGANAFAELRTSGAAAITLNTAGPIGAAGNPLQIADGSLVNIGTVLASRPASAVFLGGLGTVTLSSVSLNAADLNVTAAGDILVGNVGTLGGNLDLEAGGNVNVLIGATSGTGTIVLRGDAGGVGAGTVTVGPGAIVLSGSATSSAISLQGADLNLNGAVTATGAGGGIVIRSSVSSRPMNIGGAAGAVAGINLTDASLLELATTSSGTITFGDAAQTGNMTLTTAQPATTSGAAIVVLQSTSGAGAIVLDNASGAGIALDGKSGAISLTAGTGGVVEAPTNASSTADISTTGPTVTINTAGPIGSATNPVRFANNTNTAQQVIDIGTAMPAGQPVFLFGLGTLTLGSINLAGADFDVDAQGINLTSGIETGGGNLLFVNSASAAPAAVRLVGGNLTLATTRAGGDSGNIDLSDTSVSSAAAGQDLTIDATSAAGFNGGDITLGAFTGSQLLKNLSATTNVTNPSRTTTITLNGAVNVTSTVTLMGQAVAVNGQVNSSLAASGRTVAITADSAAINNSVFADGAPTGGSIVIENATAGRPIDLGIGSAPMSLNLSTAAIGFLNAGLVRIGRNDAQASGAITISDNLAAAGVGTLHLFTGGDVNGAGSITVGALAISAGGNVSLLGSNSVTTLAGTGQSFAFNQSGVISIGLVDGVAGINVGTGTATLTSTAGFSQTQPITAGLLTVKTLNDLGVGITLSGSANNVAQVDLESLNAAGTAAAPGTITYTSTGDTQISKITTAGIATLTSMGGSILNGTTNPNEIAAAQLQLAATNGGIGTIANPLLTSAASVTAKAGTGGVHFANNSALTIGAGGVVAAGGGIDVNANGPLTLSGPVTLSGAGNISLSSQGAMFVGSAVTGGAAGNVALSALGDVDLATTGSVQTGGNIAVFSANNFNAAALGSLTNVLNSTSGTVSITAVAANIQQPNGALSPIPPIPGFLIKTGTGLVAAAPPFVSANPVFISPGVSISVDGTTTLVVTFGRAIEQNFTVSINWGDGTIDTFNSKFAGTQAFTHTFSLASIQANTAGGTSSTLGGTTAFAVTVTVHADPRVSFFLGGRSDSVSQQIVPLISPGLGLVGTEIKQFGSPPPNTFAEPTFVVAAQGGPGALPGSQSSPVANQTSPGGATNAASDRLLLRVVPTDAAQEADSASDLDIAADLKIDINNLTTDTLRDLFAKLPDGRYRIVWHRSTGTGGATERVILDVLLRDGTPINFEDLEKPAVPLKKGEAAQPEARLPAAPGEPPADQAAASTLLPLPALGNQEPREYSERLLIPIPRAVFRLAAGVPVLTAGADLPVADPTSRGAEPAPDECSSTFLTSSTLSTSGDLAAAPLLIPAAALAELAHLRQRWSQPRSAEPNESPAGLLNHAARLYRRLRRRSDSSSIFDCA